MIFFFLQIQSNTDLPGIQLTRKFKAIHSTRITKKTINPSVLVTESLANILDLYYIGVIDSSKSSTYVSNGYEYIL